MKKTFYIILIAWLLGGHGQSFAVEPLNLTTAKDRVKAYYSSGEFDRDVNRVVDHALLHFSCDAGLNTDSEEKRTVVFDIDDTVLSNYDDMRKIEFGYISKLFHDWVLRADAPAIKPVRRLYDHLVDCGYHIVFLTGRRFDEYEATVKNLHEQGFTQFDKLIVRSPVETKITAQEYKFIERTKLRAEGYTIVGSVGDQCSDLCCEDVGFTVKIPNPLYFIP